MNAAEPIRGVLGGPEYKGGYTCTSVPGSSEYTSEGNANWPERTRAAFGCSEGGADAALVHESSRNLDKLPVEL